MKRVSLAAALLLSGTGLGRAESVEVLHYWQGPAERAALQVFSDSFEQRGGKWYDAPRANEVALKAYAIDRIKSGYAPSAVQWHGGPEIERLYSLEILSSLSEIASEDELTSILSSVADVLRVNGNVGALPVGLHGGNWLWRNTPIYRELGLEPPRDWAHFLEQAKVIRAAGYRPLAIGHAPWERVALFVAVMIDVAGIDCYKRLLEGRLDLAIDGPGLEKTFRVMQRLRDEATSPDFAHDIWSESTNDVMEGKAAAQLMGDWAKGEFLKAGKVIGRDFDCMIAPGNNETLTIVLDIFVLPKAQNPDMQKAQAMLADVVLDPENQRKFSLIKGSLPVVKGMDMHSFDACSQLGFEAISTEGGSVPSLSLSLTQERIAEIQGMIQVAWEDEDVSIDELKAMILQ